ITDCDLLLGVKEVPIDKLLPGKTYLFFSHTIKKQPHNRKMLQEIVQRKIRLIDYECLTDERGERVIAFGRFAGIVGAHNGLMAYALRTGLFHMPRANKFKSLNELFTYYSTVYLPPMKIVLAGGGRVARGAMETFYHLDIKRVTIEAFLNNNFNDAVFVQLDTEDIYFRKDRKQMPVEDFFQHPELYECRFEPYYKAAGIMV